jgi:hypothetical protein
MSTFGTPSPLWQKATRSSTENGGCVEIAGPVRGTILIRDSTRPGAGNHVVPASVFAAFLNDARTGRYDFPGP